METESEHNIILDFLGRSYLHDHENNLTKQYREEVRQEMDASAHSSSSPPFILTSELVCGLSNEEIVNIVDRIVALLDSKSKLDDDTIIRISTFCRLQLDSVYLPELFRNVGRTICQYCHAFESLLSLPIGLFREAPMNFLLTTRPYSLQPTSDEWDDVDLEAVGLVKKIIDQNQPSMIYDSKSFDDLIVVFGIQSLLQASHSTTRLCQSQLERLIAPSIHFLGHFILHPRAFESSREKRHEDIFVTVCKLCDQRVLAQCVSRTGFFSHFVAALFNHSFNASVSLLQMIVDRGKRRHLGIEDQNTIRRTIPYYLEEGWQDALEFIFVQGKNDNSPDAQQKVRWMMLFFGAN
ncbi:hypothetical protein BLNAU_14707 [Blattamonas nauphoetae]|uniref:Uncharacterized protein n=1 Tax=Blattamonas nauphoetae TaxID=2049346 RepID=A0ABQ9XGA4_9EUKA|nr:hypothetical protein BLNAU_14707 [Blattamonas nauphoetae]